MWRWVTCVFASAVLVFAQSTARWKLVRSNPTSPTDDSPSIERLIQKPGGQLLAISERLFLSSTNDGASWSSQPAHDDFRIDALAFSNPDTVWSAARTNEGTFLGASSDRGISWKKVLTLSSTVASGILDIAFFDENFGIAVGSFNVMPLVLTTRDGGQSWNMRELDSDDPDTMLRRIAFASKSEIWIVGGSSIYVSKDAGSTWEVSYQDKALLLNDIAITQSGIFVVGGWGNILRSQDDGETWSKIPLSEPLASRFLYTIAVREPGQAWVAGENGTIASTSDGGQTWQLEETGRTEFIRDLKVIGEQLMAVGNNGIILERPAREP